ncbi:pyridoxal phosphate-dependent aminotransferase [Hippea jasoniae]|uniref:pyridoxal phosphate-dependent aminotransferase n=1 Tax=Hippea jasoniae TaxID=944479 RepID=UPI000AB66326|nr:histidinol-phosphate transaminase [Hippea jasoniae]
MFKHGGNIFYWADKLNKDAKEIIDLSSNVFDGDIVIPDSDDLKFYTQHLPTEDGFLLKKRLSSLCGIDEKFIFVDSGTSPIIKSICEMFAYKKALIFDPTYIEYARFCELYGLDIKHFVAEEENGFEFEIDKARLDGVDLCFICNPNNPTGGVIKKEEILKLAGSFKKTTFVVDEAYIDFYSNRETLLGSDMDNIVVLRSLSKFYSLAGIRVGWAYTKNKVILEKLNRIALPWRISSISCIIALKNLDVNRKAIVDEVDKNRAYLMEGLKRFGFIKVFSSNVNFLLIKLNSLDGKMLESFLIKKGILIRVCDNFYSLSKDFIRISIKKRHKLDRLLEALEEL